MTYSISFESLINSLLPLAGIVVSVFASYGITLLTRKFKLDIDATHRGALQGALDSAINYGLKKAADVGKPLAHIDTHNEVLATAAQYVLSSVPDAITKFGVTDVRLRQLLEARLIPTTVALAQPIAPAVAPATSSNA